MTGGDVALDRLVRGRLVRMRTQEVAYRPKKWKSGGSGAGANRYPRPSIGASAAHAGSWSTIRTAGSHRSSTDG